MNELMNISDDALEDSKSVSNSLPTLAIHSSQSKKIGDPDYAYTLPMINKIVLIEGGEYKLIGESVEVTYVGMRRKATKYDGDFKSVYCDVTRGSDPSTYAEWRTLAKNREQGYKYGPEFLVYIPELNKYATLFCGTDLERTRTSAHIVDGVRAKNIHFLLKTYKHEGKKVKFPRTIIEAKVFDGVLASPDEEATFEAHERFMNPPVFIEDSDDRDS